MRAYVVKCEDNVCSYIKYISFIVFRRFIGELFRQQILTGKIMHRCIRHLLDQNDEDNLECLCKLLTTIGKDLESKAPQSGNAANNDVMS